MDRKEIQDRIDSLPSGGLTTKRIKGREYTYYQWTEEGKQRSRVVKGEETIRLEEAIMERKALKMELRESEGWLNGYASGIASASYMCDIRKGVTLKSFVSPVSSFKTRTLYNDIERYIYGDSSDKVLILYGLRRTGKTTLIRQIVLNMDEDKFNKTAFIQVSHDNSLSDINRDLKTLEEQGFKYVFIDEVTAAEDFISGSALFSDIYASSGMKIVLSGTDSLGFLFAEDEGLYDRAVFLHSTWISFKEFSSVLGIDDIDQYIQYGGTMVKSGTNYNRLIFQTPKGTESYVDGAIARNIQHSLKNYQGGGHFRSLYSLYEKNELTSAINRVVEDINHRFTVDVLTRDFKSHDYGSARDIIRRDKPNPSTILDEVDKKKLTEKLMDLMEILNRKDQTITIEEAHRSEIKEYLDILDISYDIPIVSMKNPDIKAFCTVISQPGIRYSQAKHLIESLMSDPYFRTIPALERKRITDRILDEIKGRMMEEIVLLETTKANPDKKVFKLQFDVGEFDMVVFDPEDITCRIFEIKHSCEVSEAQSRHLRDEKKCSETEFQYGPILEKTVLYRGEDKTADGISYRNVENYLKSLH